MRTFRREGAFMRENGECVQQPATRVLMVSTSHPWHSSRIYFREALSLSQAGYDVRVLAQQGSTGEHEPELNVRCLPPVRSRLERLFVNAIRAYRIAKTYDVDVFHFHDPEFLPLSVLLRRATGRPVIYDVHEYYPESVAQKAWIPKPLRRPIAWLSRRVELSLAARLDGVVAVNSHLGERFAKRGCRVVIAPNYPPLDVYQPDVAPHEGAQMPAGSRNVIYAGRLSDDRGISVLVSAMRLVVDACPDVNLFLLGQGSDAYMARLNATIEALALQEHVHVLGWVFPNQVPGYLAQAQVGVFLLQPVNERYLETEPIKCFEYAAAGLPVILSDLPAMRRLTEAIGNGVVVDPDAEGEIADAIVKLLGDEMTRRDMGKRGRAAFLDSYNWETVVGRLVALYAEVVGR